MPFPFTNKNEKDDCNLGYNFRQHPAIIKLSKRIDLERNCGYITMINTCGSKSSNNTVPVGKENTAAHSKLLENVLEEKGNDEDEEEEEFHLVTSSNNPPKNGFTNEICEKIYQEEIENELFSEMPNSPRPSFSHGPQGFDVRQQKLESLRLDLKFGELSMLDKTAVMDNMGNDEITEDNVRFDDWTLLDCYFGIPLFDAGVNQITCERMLNNGLWDPTRFEFVLHLMLKKLLDYAIFIF